MNDPLLEISGLTLRPAHEALVTDFSLTVERGSVHAIVGPNGAGKTTLLSAVLGLIPFDGRIVAHWAGRGRIAYVPQQFQIDRTLPVTVTDFLALSRQNFPVCLGVTSATRKRISLLLERVGLGGIETRALSVLSGGELRRVLLANALDPLPELLILDEPGGGLDAGAARWLDDTLVSLKGEITVLMVSHDSEQVRRIADRVTHLRASDADRFGGQAHIRASDADRSGGQAHLRPPSRSFTDRSGEAGAANRRTHEPTNPRTDEP